ncbi:MULTISPECIES: phage portal protein [Rhodococcus]|uniref:phage portal protein n=1 Tax=Rhodococcus TaxID=1827 RepID=UPI0009EDEB19|nr:MULTISPECIES: phage portal protein [Rhodococcus]MCE4161624.1 phage portal protein [Rhodococcus sp. Ni2]
MALPLPNSDWPPKPFDKVFTSVNECAAWWEGDPQKLSALYGGGDYDPKPASSGIVSRAIARMFWGRRQNQGQSTRRVHVPIAADLAHTSATLMFSDPPSFTIAKPDNTADGTLLVTDNATKRLDRIINTPEMHSKLLVAGESTAALGGSFVRVCWNATVADHAWLDFVDADRAIPEFRYGRLHKVTFWSVLNSGNDHETTIRHVEVHEPGTITHGLYVGTRRNIGQRVSLAAHDVTAGLADNEGGVVNTGTKHLTAGYIPNARPNPQWRNDGQLVHMGRADISRDIISLMDHVDEAYSSLARDVRLAKARIVVSEHLLNVGRPGQGSTFDVDREAFQAVATSPNGDPVIEMHQFDIRVTEHLAVATAYLREILRRAGYSPLTFGLADDSTSAMTATEIAVKERASIATHTAKSRLWQAVLAPITSALLEVDAFVFDTGVTLSENVEVDWPSAVRETELSKARTVQALETARAASTETKVAMLHPDWDEIRRGEEVTRILRENGMGGIDPFTIGADGAFQPEDDDQLDDDDREE